MARSPDHEPERIKSRLRPALPDAAARQTLYEAFLSDTLANVRAGAAECGATVKVAFTPRGAEAAFARFGVAAGELLPQRGDTLGDRERNLFEDLFAEDWRHVVLVGSDLPTLPPVHIEEAFGGLARDRPALVLGPSGDGGYYLIGLNASAWREGVPDLFSAIRWSTSHALSDTLEAAERYAPSGLAVRLIDRWHDVDEPDDLARLRGELADPSTARRAPATAKVLNRSSVI